MATIETTKKRISSSKLINTLISKYSHLEGDLGVFIFDRCEHFKNTKEASEYIMQHYRDLFCQTSNSLPLKLSIKEFGEAPRFGYYIIDRGLETLSVESVGGILTYSVFGVDNLTLSDKDFMILRERIENLTMSTDGAIREN